MNLFGYDKKKVFILGDGLEGVKKTSPNLIEKGKEKVSKEGNFDIKNVNTEEFIGYESLSNDLKSKKSLVVLDVRDNIEWVGLSSSPYGPDFTPRKGRISKSKHLLWTDLMKDSKDFREDKEIETIMKGLGIENKDEELVVYCFKGCRSSNSLVALKKAGYKNTKNYLGSWNEWSRILELPIDDKVLK
jgi:thiosulfate/3-mercaptopyruvate sulfurtransferase